MCIRRTINHMGCVLDTINFDYHFVMDLHQLNSTIYSKLCLSKRRKRQMLQILFPNLPALSVDFVGLGAILLKRT